jgi:hypothetical protein
MDEHGDVIPRGGDRGADRPATLVAYGGVGTILVLGIAAAYLFTGAGPEALSQASIALMTTAAAGLLVMAAIVFFLLRFDDDPGGPDGRWPWTDEPPAPHPPTPDDLDAELFRMLDAEACPPHPDDTGDCGRL